MAWARVQNSKFNAVQICIEDRVHTVRAKFLNSKRDKNADFIGELTFFLIIFKIWPHILHLLIAPKTEKSTTNQLMSAKTFDVHCICGAHNVHNDIH